MHNKTLFSLVGIVTVLLTAHTLRLPDTAVESLSIDTADTASPITKVAQFVGSPDGSGHALLGNVPRNVPVAVSNSTKPTSINGVPISRVVVLSDAVRNNIRKIFATGQAAGRNARAFSKVGDSTMVWPPFMAVFDDRSTFKLGQFSFLEPTVAFYTGSFARDSIAARKGMHTWTEFDPAWVEPGQCFSGEGPLPCELRRHNPSIAIIRLGANDVSAPKLFEERMRKIVEYCIANGVIPILGTKPDRLEGPENTLNKIVKRISLEFKLPFWDYDVVAATVLRRGLEQDNVHIRGIGSHNFAASKAFTSGDSLQDLTGLLILDAVYQETKR